MNPNRDYWWQFKLGLSDLLGRWAARLVGADHIQYHDAPCPNGCDDIMLCNCERTAS